MCPGRALSSRSPLSGETASGFPRPPGLTGLPEASSHRPIWGSVRLLPSVRRSPVNIALYIAPNLIVNMKVNLSINASVNVSVNASDDNLWPPIAKIEKPNQSARARTKKSIYRNERACTGLGCGLRMDAGQQPQSAAAVERPRGREMILEFGN